MLKGNKGEWSELYVLLSLLADGKLYQSDIELNKNDDFYKIIKGYKQERDYLLSFDRSESIISLFKSDGKENKLINSMPIDDYKKNSIDLYKGIVLGKGKSFQIKKLEDFLSKLQILNIKEKSTEKSDIRLRIYDHRLAKETELGFSIKSLIGGKSTLFNPGNSTNFIFDISAPKNFEWTKFNEKTYKPTLNISKLSYRFQELEKLNFEVKYSGIQSKQLWKNLKIIDGDLPEILSYALYYRWLKQTSSLSDVVEILEHRDPLNFYSGEVSEQKFYEYKLMRFLTECAMGMTPQKPWLGKYDLFGGVIVAKNDGDIVVFHIYDFNIFRDYLINNTKFDQPSTGEDKQNPGNPNINSGKKYNYGWIYKEEGKLKIKINLQIRFK